MDHFAQIALWLEAAVKSGVLGLALVLVGIVYQTRMLNRCTRRDELCAANLTKARVAVARLYSIVKARLGEADPIPSLEELMSDRRNPPMLKPER